MKTSTIPLAVCSLAAFAVLVASPAFAAPSGGLSAAQIIAKNVAARGGIKAWRAVRTLTLSGQLEAGGKQNSTLPFVLQLKREHKSRLEVRFQDQTAIQVYDGKQGWKVRPFLGRDEVEPFSPAEVKEATEWQELDGPLMDYAHKGTKVKLQGSESVDGHKAYKLLLTMRDGSTRHVWIDAKSFLELKIDGEPRKLDGKMHSVEVYYRDYKKTKQGVTVPYIFETVVDGSVNVHKMNIDHVLFNQPMEDTLFAKPQAGMVRTSYR